MFKMSFLAIVKTASELFEQVEISIGNDKFPYSLFVGNVSL